MYLCYKLLFFIRNIPKYIIFFFYYLTTLISNYRCVLMSVKQHYILCIIYSILQLYYSKVSNAQQSVSMTMTCVNYILLFIN